MKPTFTKSIEYRADDVTIIFTPTANVPGFTHQVLIVTTVGRKLIARDWLCSDSNVSERAARYYYGKHVSREAA